MNWPAAPAIVVNKDPRLEDKFQELMQKDKVEVKPHSNEDWEHFL